MYLFEYALCDFMNVERFARWDTAIVLDDMSRATWTRQHANGT